MGYLDNLLRREVRKVVSSAVDTVADSVINAVLGKDGRAGENTASVTADHATVENNAGRENKAEFAVSRDSAMRESKARLAVSGEGAIRENKAATRQANCSGEGLLRRRIEEIAAREKPEYELRQRVPSSQVGAPRGAEPYFDYGFYQNGILVAVIQILDSNNAYCRRSVRLAQQACEDRQVAYMNLMSYMTNRPEYIAKRLRENLR